MHPSHSVRPEVKKWHEPIKQFLHGEHRGRQSLSTLARFARYEFAALLCMLVLFAAVWGFIELADEVSEGDTRSVDETLLLSLRNPADHTDPLGPRWLEELGRDFTALGAAWAALCWLAFRWMQRRGQVEGDRG